MKTLFGTIMLGVMMFTASELHAQQIQVISTPELDSLVERNQQSNLQNPTISGYRVQIFFGSDRKAANDARTKFLQLYPELDAYLVYQQPNFKVRVGDFRTQQEAQAIFRNLLTHFDKVFIVPDKINLPKL
jgi:hypothetical protein